MYCTCASLFAYIHVHVHVHIIRGAEIDAQDVNLSTPLLVAAANGQVDAIRTLTRWKADVDVLDKNKRSAVYIACEYKHATLLKVWQGESYVTCTSVLCTCTCR